MLRVHFTGGDLARTRVADGPDPLWETVLSLHRLRPTHPEPALRTWREHVARTHHGPLRQLLPLVPARGYFPDFLTPAEGAQGFETGLDALLSTPRDQLRRQIATLGESVPLTPEVRDLARGDVGALGQLGGALRAYQHAALVPWWQRVTARIENDRTWRTRTQWSEGTGAMLSGFGPALRWRPPVLEADYPVDRDLYLEGRGLLLVPSFFCRRTPVALADPALPPTLVYRADTGTRPQAARPLAPATGLRLARLLGHTRAAVLQALSAECTTSELARRVGVSLSSASEHASVLRGAGLIASDRRRSAVHHSLTPVGLALLDEAPGRAVQCAPTVPRS